MNRVLSLGVALALSLLVGCTATKEVAVITERAERTDLPTLSGPHTVKKPESKVEDIEVGRFDGGKMWTFDNVPVEYFNEEYGISVDSVWMGKAMRGALRFSGAPSGCSASFVSSKGLVLTNHHCARHAVVNASDQNESLLHDGFYADALESERKIEGISAEQLIGIEDVTSSILGASRRVRGDDEILRVRASRVEELEDRMTRQIAARDSSLQVRIVELYSGSRYAAYTFKRYTDIRLVMAPELSIGYFGGHADNFTFPRYALDFAFFRVYDEKGKPYETEDYFQWSHEGVSGGDAVFTIGNPGETQRLGAVSSLRYIRDYNLPMQIDWMERSAAVLEPYLDIDAVNNTYFSLRNSLKILRGQLDGLEEGFLLPRRMANEERLKTAIAESDSLSEAYGDLFVSVEEVQISRRAEAKRLQTIAYFGTRIASPVLTRALYAYYYATLKRRGFTSDEDLAEIRKEAMSIPSVPKELETALIALRLEFLREGLGENDPTFRRISDGDIDSVAARIVAETVLTDSTGLDSLLSGNYLSSSDATVEVIEALAPLYFTTTGQAQSFDNRERLLVAKLAQLQFLLDGDDIPPDASSSLRISDGRVEGYEYNGTMAPSITTFFGLYDHYHAYRGVSGEWNLPERWVNPPDSMDLSVPVNFVTTSDVSPGSSGSPVVNKDLEVVGVLYGGNVEWFPNDYLYTDESARGVSVDVRGIHEALEYIYKAHRLVTELQKPQP